MATLSPLQYGVEADEIERCLHDIVISEAGDSRSIHFDGPYGDLWGFNISRSWIQTAVAASVGLQASYSGRGGPGGRGSRGCGATWTSMVWWRICS